MDEFNKRLEKIRKDSLEERKIQRMAKRREDFIRARREEKRKEREEQQKRGMLRPPYLILASSCGVLFCF